MTTDRKKNKRYNQGKVDMAMLSNPWAFHETDKHSHTSLYIILAGLEKITIFKKKINFFLFKSDFCI